MYRQRRVRGEAMTLKVYLIGAVLFTCLACAATVQAEEKLHDPALPTASDHVLHQLSDSRTRQQIMAERQSHFPGRCVCQYQTKNFPRTFM